MTTYVPATKPLIVAALLFAVAMCGPPTALRWAASLACLLGALLYLTAGPAARHRITVAMAVRVDRWALCWTWHGPRAHIPGGRKP